MKTDLYNIGQRYLEVLDLATDPETEIDIGDTLEAVEGEFEQKAIAVAGYFRRTAAWIDELKEAEASIRDRRKVAENASVRLKAYLEAQMTATGIKKIECPYFVITLAKCPPSVRVDNPELVPDEFKHIEIVETIDKDLIKKAGGCEGVTIVTNQSVRIK
jgi:hypothetical protein